MTSNPTDHDNDGILSINEDIDGDGDPLGDDTDNDNIWNMYDSDDDGDGTLTINESVSYTHLTLPTICSV